LQFFWFCSTTYLHKRHKLLNTRPSPAIIYALHSENTTNVNDTDYDTTNELQYIVRIGNHIIVNKGGGLVTDKVNDEDADTTNEIQFLSLNGTNDSIS